jgi:N-acetylmuramoyl-L-alanine amidase
MCRGFRLFALSSSALLLLPVLSPKLWIYQKSGFSAFSQKWVLSGALLQQNPLPPPNAPQTAQSQAPEEPIGVTVILDPAHGGADFGARGPTGLAESDVVLDFARAARIALEAQRLRVLLTREGNQDPSFDNRSAMVNGLHNAIFISLHVSSSGPVGTARSYY